MPISMLKYIKTLRNVSITTDHHQERVCTSLKLLNYLKNTEFKILKIIPGVVAASIRGDPYGSPHILAATTPGMIFRILNSVFFLNNSVT